ncbi:MAG TPA: amidohydrolase family protein [Actinophytocola sp.]|jgi:predicted TIM-barrel fold metal-dependent hydrolase|nr:amidohydrolase family protein [Actinophytocola sp.]
MEIVDAQLHPPEPVADWPFEDSRVALSCELAREAMDSVGVDAALMLTGDARYCEYAIRTYPGRFAGCLTIDPDRADIADFVAGFRDRPGMVALRVIARSWTDGELTAEFTDGRYEPALAAAEKHGVPVFIQAAGHREALESVVRAHPDLQFVLDHAGLNQQPTAVADDPWAQVPDVVAMAAFPNVAVKLTGIPTLSRVDFPYRDVWPHVHRILDAFGVERAMWGSDFTRLRYAPRSVRRGPRAGWYGLYSDSVAYLRDTGELSADAKEALFGGTIRRLLDWRN